MKNELVFTVLPENVSHNIFAMKDLEDPAELMEKALDDVTDAFAALYNNYKMSYDEFYTYIQFHNDDLSKDIDKLWDNINCDIYDHYEQETLFSFELSNWKAELIDWKEKIVAAIRDIVKVEFFDEFRPGQVQTAYVEAA